MTRIALVAQSNPHGIAVFLVPAPTPVPIPTLVLGTTAEAIITLWACQVKCFPILSATGLESSLDPPPGDYIVKDKASTTHGSGE